MPARYWEQVAEATLVWDLQVIHAFLAKLADAEPDNAQVAVDWRHNHELGVTKVLVSTWDRHGLLAKIAAALSAMRVSIIRADAYTRADNVVLDVFEVCDLDHRSMLDPARLQAVTFLIEGALCQPPRFASIWAAQSHKWRPSADQIVPRVRGDNRSSPDHTVLRVEASDRRGLLYDILQSLTDCELSVNQAVVNTIDGVALDVFYLVDLQGRRIVNPARLRRICRKVSRAILS
ncbi:MAG: hypothetical protein HYZ36_06070, partial [Pedosphaera parvula]|nr:hypothetical protein [Pedosphaera parvula]